MNERIEPAGDDEDEQPSLSESELATARELGVEDLAATILAEAHQEEEAVKFSRKPKESAPDAEPAAVAVAVAVAEPAAQAPITPVVERVLVRQPGTGALAIDPHTGTPLWPPQQELPDLEAPDQVYTDVPADAWYYTDAGWAMAEGWKPPRPDIEEVIRQREALHLARRKLEAIRSADMGGIYAAIRAAADLSRSPEDAADGLAAAMQAVAVSEWLDRYIGKEHGPLGDPKAELETLWRALLFKHQRAMLQSLLGRDSVHCINLRAMVASMDRTIQPPGLGQNERVVY